MSKIGLNSFRLLSKLLNTNYKVNNDLFMVANNVSRINAVNYSIKFKTPANNHKVFRPSTIAVTNANKHLEINLLDENNVDLGKMSMANAHELAIKNPQLKLVIIDESTRPPIFKLMTGNDLYQMQMKYREESRADKEAGNKTIKEKEVDINLGISDHDLDIKVKMIQNFHAKGHSIKIKIKSVIIGKKGRNIPKLQDEFLEKLKKLINFAKFNIEKRTENLILIQIQSSKTAESEKK